MASSQTLLSFLLLLLLSVLSLTSSSRPPTTALVLPVSKHSSLQYTTTIIYRTPPVPLRVVLDLSGPFLWLTCGPTYNSTTYHSAHCHSPLCPLSHNGHKLCNNNNNDTCTVLSQNVFTSKVSKMELGEDVLSLNSTNGFYTTSVASILQFPFLCAPEFLSKGLEAAAAGVVGLGHGRLGLPELLSDAFNLGRKFAICLPSSRNDVGVLFFGDGPYVFSPGIDVSKLLISTPLIKRATGMGNMTIRAQRRGKTGNLKAQRHPFYSYNYYFRVKYMRVKGKRVPLSSSLLAKISTVSPYTTMESSIYRSLTKMFLEEALAANATRVAPRGPFGICFVINEARPMPFIDLVLQSEEVFWRILETNSMVEMGNGTSCLGFLDGGVNTGSSITIGSRQLEDNLLQFDLVSSKLGFTNTLLFRETNCASFNFASVV
ncbi:hypothetical protein NMG60_11020716 [Bertholletia excelsa]